MRRRDGGFTLIELTTSVALITILGGILGATASRMARTDLLARSYADDVLGARRAIAAIEGDLRAAARIGAPGAAGAALEVVTPSGDHVFYRLRAGVLERQRPARAPEPLAQNVERFEVARAGDLERVEIALGKRAGESPRRPIIVSYVLLRCEEARK